MGTQQPATQEPAATKAEEEKETTKAATEAPVEDKVAVKFDMTMNIKPAEYEANKDKIKTQIAKTLGKDESKVTVTRKSRRNRRFLQDSVNLEVTVKAADDAAATAIKSTVQGSSFAADLAKAVNESTNLNVEITGVTEPSSEPLTTSTT